MIEQTVELATKDGAMTTFVVHPDRGAPHPVLLFFMDAPGIREELRDMARRFATGGYCVMLPNLYYRKGVLEIPPAELADPQMKKMGELAYSLTIPGVMEDTAALLAYAGGLDAADADQVVCVGYCMSGQYSVSAAATFPDRVKAAASVYGTLLVTDKPDSPHLAARKAKGELYFACAETDSWAPAEMIEALEASLKADSIGAEVEIYPGVTHGFAFPKRPAYDKGAAEQHWERLYALFERNLD
jgi:carboxymethylenebutenolidase